MKFKYLVLTPLVLTLCGSALLAQNPAAPPATPATPPAPAEPVDMNAVSHIIGADLGKRLRTSEVEANMEVLIAAIKEAFAGAEPKYTPEQEQQIMTAFQNDLRAKMEKKQAELGAKNTKLAEEFLAANGKKEGVVTTKSGLQYQVIKEGTGPKPTAADKVKAIYKGELINGTVFDDSRGQPREFPVGGVVKGWQEALPLMATGSKWKLFVPPDLGYGPMQRGPVIEPNSVLVFEIELVEISKAPVTTSPPVAVPTMPTPANPNTAPRKPVTAVTPPIAIPARPTPAKPETAPRKPVTAVTPPIAIPPLKKDGEEAPKSGDKKP